MMTRDAAVVDAWLDSIIREALDSVPALVESILSDQTRYGKAAEAEDRAEWEAAKELKRWLTSH